MHLYYFNYIIAPLHIEIKKYTYNCIFYNKWNKNNLNMNEFRTIDFMKTIFMHEVILLKSVKIHHEFYALL